MEQAILVYIDLMGISLKVGRLWGRFRNGRESVSFEYDRDWLNHPQRFSLDPALKLVIGHLFMHHLINRFLEQWMIRLQIGGGAC